MPKIFISHNYKDKPIIEPVAIKLGEIYGRENVFYDSWTIQPGDEMCIRDRFVKTSSLIPTERSQMHTLNLKKFFIPSLIWN